MRFFLVAVVIVLVTYGQLIIKYEVNRMGAMPLGNIKEAIGYGFGALTRLYILSGLFAAALAALLMPHVKRSPPGFRLPYTIFLSALPQMCNAPPFRLSILIKADRR